MQVKSSIHNISGDGPMQANNYPTDMKHGCWILTHYIYNYLDGYDERTNDYLDTTNRRGSYSF